MKWKHALLLLFAWGMAPGIFAQLCPPAIRSQHALRDFGFVSIKPLSDGGYILSGTSYPGLDPDQTSPNYSADGYLVRLDRNFTRVWDQTFGGTAWEGQFLAEELTDGFIVAGNSLSGPSGNKTSENFGEGDFWVIRTDRNGAKLWERDFGGTNYESLFCLRKTADGGCIVGGISQSQISGNKTSPNYGNVDYWVVRIDGNGNKLWERSFGGLQRDVLYAIEPLADGGFLLGGTSESEQDGNRTAINFGGRDYWVIRVDANGQELWQRSFGGTGSDELLAMSQGSSGIALFGTSDSPHSGTKTAPNRGYRDYWLVVIDASGNELWNQTAGGSTYAEAKSIVSLADGGWLAGGNSGPGVGGNKTSPGNGYSDYWLVRFDSAGGILWDQSYGGNSGEYFYGLEHVAGGGFFVSGQSYSPAGGNKTVPLLNSPDLWLLQLAPETPGDCDGDGVPDEQDLCSATGGGAVDAHGCSIAQLCPCDGGWTNHNEYVNCVSSRAIEFYVAGRITAEQEDAIIAEAAAASCPISPIIAFGLTNFPIRQAVATSGDDSGAIISVSNLGFEGFDGLSMRLGEADAGLFIYPDAPIQDSFGETWFMEGNVLGSRNGVTNALLATMRATKPYYETYPVTVDFSPLGPSSLTFQLYLNGSLVAQSTQPGATGTVTVYSASRLGPRANPLWHARDGSVGAVIDFDLSETPYRFTITGPFGDSEEGLQADRIFIRADNPTNSVDFVSRMDLTGGGGLYGFSVLNARLGMFGRPHQILGAGLFEAANRKLTISRVESEEPFAGVLLEARQESFLNVTLVPVSLETNTAMFQLTASGRIEADTGIQLLGMVTLARSGESLQLTADFSPLYSPSPDGTNSPPPAGSTRVSVYDHGTFVGSFTNSGPGKALTLSSSNGVPMITGAGVVLAGPTLFATLDRVALVTDDNTQEFVGDQLRITPLDPQVSPDVLSAFTLGGTGISPFTITAENSEPPLTITRSGNQVILSWPRYAQGFIPQSAPALGESFTPVSEQISQGEEFYSVALPIDTGSNRFFRLSLPGY
jgi:hypothetical protein